MVGFDHEGRPIWTKVKVRLASGGAPRGTFPAFVVEGYTWNGWQRPYFPLTSAESICQKMGRGSHVRDIGVGSDATTVNAEGEREIWHTQLIVYPYGEDGKIIRTWMIGDSSWVWEVWELAE